MIIKRKCKFINKKTVAALMCGAIFLSAPQVANAGSLPAAAAQPTHNANVAVNIGTEPLVVDITVPGTLGFAFNADGSNEVPDNFIITNNNKLAVFYLKELSVDAGGSGWKIAGNDQSIALDEKTIKLSAGLKMSEKEITPTNGTKDSTGKATFNNSEFVLEPQTPTTMNFLVNRPIFTEKIEQSKAFDMSMTFEMK